MFGVCSTLKGYMMVLVVSSTVTTGRLECHSLCSMSVGVCGK